MAPKPVDPSPWSYALRPEQPIPIEHEWRKVLIPCVKVDLIRCGSHQIGDVVTIQLERSTDDGLIVNMFRKEEGTIKCVIAWIYSKKTAKVNSRMPWPKETSHLISNHFDVVDIGCLVEPTRRIRHTIPRIQYIWGLNIITKRVDRLTGSENSIVAVNKFKERAFEFLSLPAELQEMVFHCIKDAEPKEFAPIDCKAVFQKRKGTLNSNSFWGLRNASPQLRRLADTWLLKNKPIRLRLDPSREDTTRRARIVPKQA